jgi:HK97 gp10 family phage protein
MFRNRIPVITAELQPRVDLAIREAAQTVERAAKQRVPVASGQLRDAIHVEQGDGGTYVIAGDQEAFYGHMVEFGTTRTPARPFLIPALEESAAMVVNDVRQAIKRAVE